MGKQIRGYRKHSSKPGRKSLYWPRQTRTLDRLNWLRTIKAGELRYEPSRRFWLALVNPNLPA